MAVKSTSVRDRSNPKSVASMIREAIERNGFKDVKECARSIRVPYDLFNKVVGGHIPKDSQLLEYAKRLHLDARELILAAYREKAPDEMKPYLNSVALIEDHNPAVREMKELLDASNADQLTLLLQLARLVRTASREQCRKSVALLKVYGGLEPELVEHLDSLILLALRHEQVEGLKDFREAAAIQQGSRDGRRARLRS